MFIKVFLAAVVVLALLGCIGANQRENKRLAAGIALVALILLTVVMVSGSSKKRRQADSSSAGIRGNYSRPKPMGNDYSYGQGNGHNQGIPGLYTYFRQLSL